MVGLLKVYLSLSSFGEQICAKHRSYYILLLRQVDFPVTWWWYDAVERARAGGLDRLVVFECHLHYVFSNSLTVGNSLSKPPESWFPHLKAQGMELARSKR